MKKIFSFAAAMILVLVMFVSVHAVDDPPFFDSYDDVYLYRNDNDDVSESATEQYGADYDFSAPDSKGAYVVDWADLLTDEQEASLLKKIDELRSKYAIDVVIHTTNSIGNKSVRDYADDFYDYNGYGVGPDHDGLMFMLNMNNGEEGNRDYYTTTTGRAIEVLTDYAVYDSDSYINSRVLPYLADGEYYEAFEKYLDLIDVFFEQAETGEPFDVGNTYKTSGSYVSHELIAVGIAVIVAFLVTNSMKNSMKTNRKKTEASNYVKPGSMYISESFDRFSYRNVSRVAKPESSSSGGGGGSSSHSSSSGSSHGGGGGKF
ncbi:MAG: TPM domain-containing protein [Clostridiales bacterium]|nr:TPM domain-containing protein [Clostridiales bacterium]